MNYKRIITLIILLGLCFLALPGAQAQSSLEKNYKNLYYSGITFSDVYHLRRIIIKQTYMKSSVLYKCTLDGLPTPYIYLENIVKNGKIQTSEQPGLYWFLTCNQLGDQVKSHRFGGLVRDIRRGSFDGFLQNSLSVTDNTEFQPIKDTSVTILREYVNYPESSRIQYYEHDGGVSMVFRNREGAVEMSKTVWRYILVSGTDESALLQAILGKRWYQP